MSASVQNSRPRARRPNPNHVPNNNRGGYSNSNSHRRETPESEIPQSPPANSKGIYGDPRTAMMMCTVLGAHSTVKTRNGNKYKGHTIGFSEKGDIAMTDAKLEVEDSAYQQHIPGIVIPKDNFVVCVTNGVDIKGLAVGSSDFTDAGIASRVNGSSQAAMKELQPWQDDDADTTTPMALDDDQTGGWDPSAMFQQNKEKFNLKTSFPEDLRGYTTDLPDPSSEGYEERARLAQRHAEEIERSPIYQTRIAKEIEDGDEEAQFSAVHRNEKESGVHRTHDGHSGSAVKAYTCPALRGADSEHNAMRNGNQPRQVGRPSPRQNSPNFPQQSIHNPRQQHMNNHYHQGPQMPNRNQRQQQSQSPNHAPPANHPHHHPHSMQQAPPLSQVPLHQPSRPPHQPPQVTSQPSKPNLPHPNVPSINQQHVPAQKSVHPQQSLMMDSKTAPLHSQPPPSHKAPVSQHVNGDGHHISEVNSTHKPGEHYGVPSNPTCAPLIPASKAPEPVTNVNSMDHKSGAVMAAAVASVSPQNAANTPMPGMDRRNGRGQDPSPDENHNKAKNKMQQLKEFSNKFVLNDSSKCQESSSESTEDNSNKSSTGTSGIGTSDSSPLSNPNPSSGAPPATPTTTASEQKSGNAPKAMEKSVDSDTSKSEVTKSTLNPLAAEFKPKTAATQVEAQASPPPPRASPLVMPPTFATWLQPSHIPAGIPYQGRSKGVLARGDLTAQVTGQPLLAHGQHMIYMPTGQGQPYQVYAPRMVAPNSFPVSQAGHQGLDQSSPQPSQLFVANQQQLMSAPIPAHLTHHPQPAHGQPMPNPTSQQPQPAHIPNPAPSPVQHQQQQQGHGGQPMPHPIPQGPPQSVTPQPAHYSHVNLPHGLQGMPRTSAGQHGMAGPGHPSVSINYSNLQYSYPNVSSAQNSFVSAPQPQMSQNSNHHNPGHQPQYVVMPQPQGHNPMQTMPGQPYPSAGLQFQPQHNILHGPPQMPPNHSHNPNQGAANFMHPAVQGMPAGLQQVTGAPSSMLMPMHQQYQPQP